MSASTSRRLRSSTTSTAATRPIADRLQRLIGLFRLDFADPREMRADVAGKPVYLGLAMNAEQTLKLKPQNLLINLPLAASA